MVCDIQGVCDGDAYRYTDPAIHSTKHKGRYGRTDRGQDGIEKFYLTHECNEVCEKLGLPMRNCKEVRNRFRERKSSSMSRNRDNSSLVSLSRCNSNTSDVSVDKTHHLQGRMDERGVSTQLLRQARKHGRAHRQSNGNIRFQQGDTNYVTDRRGRKGVTCYRDSHNGRSHHDQREWKTAGKRGRSWSPPPPRAPAKRQTARADTDGIDDKRKCAHCGDVGCTSLMKSCRVHSGIHFHSFCGRGECPKC
jgi:hypothetical protein